MASCTIGWCDYSFHADFWNTWTQSRIDSLVDVCLNAHINCGELRS
jgi:hypothetical protein